MLNGSNIEFNGCIFDVNTTYGGSFGGVFASNYIS